MRTTKANKEKIQLAMARKCMSVKELQEKADMTRSSLSNVMSGRSIKPETLGKVARALNCDVLDILADEEKED